MSGMPKNLDGFLPFLLTSDTKMKLSIGGKIYTYLGDASNSIECSDIGQFIDMLILWLSSSNFKVSQVSLEILTELVNRMKSDFQIYVPSILPCVVDKLGDNKETIREKAVFLMMKLMECKAISPQNLLDKIVNITFSHKNCNVREQILIFLIAVLDEYGSQSLCISKLIPSIVKLISDPNGSVRSTAFNTLVGIYKHVGEKLRADLQKKYSVPPNKLSLLMQAFDDIKIQNQMLPCKLTTSLKVKCDDDIDEVDKDDSSFIIKRSFNVTQLNANTTGSVTPTTGVSQLVLKSAKSSVHKSGTLNNQVGAMDEETFAAAFENVADIRIYTGKDVEDLIRKASDIINNVSHDWSKRIEQLKVIRSLICAGALNNYEDIFYNNVNLLLPAFHTSIKDLRSQVVREVSITIAYLSKNLKNKFDHQAESILNSLINLIQNSAKIIASSGLLCVRFILQYTHTPRLIPIIANNLGSKSKDIRRACCEFICIILRTWSTSSMGKHMLLLQDAVKKGITDADPVARIHSRKAYWAFSQHYPDQAESLLNTLDYSYRKLLVCNSDSRTNLRSTTPKTNVTKSDDFKSSIVKSNMTGEMSSRSSSAIDLQAAKRAKVRAQYAALSRQKGTLPRPPKQVLAAPVKNQALDRVGRTKSRISVSQPASRSGSPSSRFSYAGNVRSSSSLFNKSQQCNPMIRSRSTNSSREPSPNRFLTAVNNIKGKPPIQLSHISSIDGKSISKKAFSSFDDRSDESETSSICSDHSFDIMYKKQSNSPYSWNGSSHHWLQQYTDLTSTAEVSVKNISEIIADCESIHWNDRKEGLISLQYYIENGNEIAPSELKQIMDIFTKIFNDPHIKVFSLFLDSLNKLIINYHDQLHFCFYLLITRLLNKLGTDLLTSIHSKIMNTLDTVSVSFPPDLQLQSVFRFLVDPTQTPNVRVKIATLHYIIKLTQKADPCLVFISSSTDKNKDYPTMALGKLIDWTSENIKQGVELRKAAQDSIIALFNLNTPQVTLRFSLLPKEQQEIAANLIKNKLYPVNNTECYAGDEQPCSPTSFDLKLYDLHSNSITTTNTTTTPPNVTSLNNISFLDKLHNDDADGENHRGDAATVLNSSAASTQKNNNNKETLSSDSVSDSSNTLYSLTTIDENDLLKKCIDNFSYIPDNAVNVKKNVLLQIELILQESSSEVISKNFKILLRLILSLLSDMETPDVKETVIFLLQMIVKRKDITWYFTDYIELIVLKVMNASRDSSKDVVKAAESCAITLSTYLPAECIIRVIIPLITAEDYPINLLAVKMLTCLVENSRHVVADNINQIMPSLLSAYDNPDSCVRKSAVFCMVAIHKELGENTISSYINTLSGAKLKLLHLYINRTQSNLSNASSPKSS